jgi:hypothetical protein
MTDLMPRPSPPRMAKFAVPTIITLIFRTRAGGTVFVIVVAVLTLAVLRSRPSSPRSSAYRAPHGSRCQGDLLPAMVGPFAPDRNKRANTIPWKREHLYGRT